MHLELLLPYFKWLANPRDYGVRKDLDVSYGFFFFFACVTSLVSQTVKNLPAIQESQVGRIPWRREWNPLQYCGLENPMDRGAWRATVHGVAQSQTRLNN